jgi:hypothetical protein
MEACAQRNLIDHPDLKTHITTVENSSLWSLAVYSHIFRGIIYK